MKKTFSYFAWLVAAIAVFVVLFRFFDLRVVSPRTIQGGQLQSSVSPSDSAAVANVASATIPGTNTLMTKNNGPNGAILGAAVLLPIVPTATPSSSVTMGSSVGGGVGSSIPIGGAGIAASVSVASPPSPPPSSSSSDEAEQCETSSVLFAN